MAIIYYYLLSILLYYIVLYCNVTRLSVSPHCLTHLGWLVVRVPRCLRLVYLMPDCYFHWKQDTIISVDIADYNSNG